MISYLCSCHLDSLAVKNSNWNWELKQTQTLSPLWIFCLFVFGMIFHQSNKIGARKTPNQVVEKIGPESKVSISPKENHNNLFPQVRHYYIKVPSLHRGATSFRINIKTYILCGAEETVQIHTIIIPQMQDRYVTSPQDLETVFRVHHSIVTLR